MRDPGVVSLLVNGMLYEGWVSVEVSRSIKKMAGEFSLVVSERWTGGNDGPASLMGWRIEPGDACVLLYDGRPVVTGYVDAYNPKYTATSHEVTIQGRSKTGDLCDSSAEADVPNGEMRNTTLDQVARKIAKPYGINVRVQADASEQFDVVRVLPGEKAQRFLERYARPGAVCLTDDQNGDLRLVHVDGAGGGASLIEGVNILEASAVLRADNRHSNYQVKGQDHGTDSESGKPVAQRGAEAKDKSIKRHRPLRLLNESKTSKKHARSRAAWEATARAGESTRVEVKVVDWVSVSGKLWMPGDMVPVISPMLAIERVLAIESVKHHQSAKDGTVTNLTLVPPEALNPKSKGKGSAGKGGSAKQWTETKPDEEPNDI